MNLTSFGYKNDGWDLTEIGNLQPTNLLVGKNASGKTRTIRALQNVTAFMKGRMVPFADKSFRTRLAFIDSVREGWTMVYTFEIADGKVKHERLVSGGKTILSRESGKAKLYGDVINPPADKLAVQVRRDRDAYPDVEMLMKWAEGVVAISCSDINPYTIVTGLANFINPFTFNDLVRNMSHADKQEVIGMAKHLGYNLTEIDTVEANSEMKLVAVRERYVKQAVLDFQLSSGMLRVLYVLCFLEYLGRDGNDSSLLLIDDLCEGLDYSRATLLGKKVFEVCEECGPQLIVSSNDSFLMDVTDVRKWQIMRRKNSKIVVLNSTKHHDLFRRFRMTGLSNFDLFSSDFIDNYLKSLEK